MRDKCPVHKIPDCSPLLNGCSILTSWLPAHDDTLLTELADYAADPEVKVPGSRRQLVEWLLSKRSGGGCICTPDDCHGAEDHGGPIVCRPCLELDSERPCLAERSGGEQG